MPAPMQSHMLPQQQVITIPKWKPKFKKNKHFAMLIFASRNSGKSYLMRHLIRDHLKKLYDLFIVVSDSPDTKSDFQPCLPKEAIFLNDMNFSMLNVFAKTNEQIIKEGKEPLNLLILFDDKVGNDVKNDQNLLQLFTRGRHLNISIIFSSQSKKLSETTWLNNADYTILLKSNSAQQKKTILENVLKGTVDIQDEKQENTILRQIVREYCSNQGDALVIDNAARSNNNLHWYRAP